MEHQWFCHEKDAMKYYEYYKRFAMDFFVNEIGINKNKLRYKDHDKLAHYAKAACDVQYLFPFGWEELNGTHHRGTWDLTRHQEYSNKSMMYTDPFTNETFIPTVIEHTIGADRLTLVALCDAYEEQDLGNGDMRVVMHFKPSIAPYKVAVLPLQKNLSEKAKEIYKNLKKSFMCTYDKAGSIGKRYRRQDQAVTPYCITIDFETLENNTVTIRDRDTMEQVRINISDIEKVINEKIK